MKLLIHSNAPTVKTGYGVQVALLADRLASDGHDVAVSATWGQPAGVGAWISPSGHKITVYPNGFLVSGDDVVLSHARHFFGSDQDGWIIPLIDVWSMLNPGLAAHNVAAWAPVDHDPAPPEVVKFFDRSKARPVAMSRHGAAALSAAGLDPAFIPLAVDTTAYRPTFSIEVNGRRVSAREFFNLPDLAFVVGMVGMNKDPNDRKGFVEAFTAFAEFRRTHPDAVLFVHTERYGAAGGINLPEVAHAVGIPDAALRWTDPYAYLVGLPADVMALAYTAMDVLLAPSAGEGFCVPLIEAQACGTVVVASDFTAQTELVGAGWLVGGQRWWDQASHSWYQRPNVGEIVDRLSDAYDADLSGMQSQAVEFARQFDADAVYAQFWRPFLTTLDERPPADKPLMDEVVVVVPLCRTENLERLVGPFMRYTHYSPARQMMLVCDDEATAEAVRKTIDSMNVGPVSVVVCDRGTSYASKVNYAYAHTTAEWLLLVGDDVEFTLGWFEAARALSDRYDVIGTNDSEPGRIRNPKVANGSHADHFFVRRSYVEDEGASLEGPGILAPEAYFHFFVDVELIQLAKARGVFAPCLDSVIVHHHPGYDGREDLRQADPVYMKAVEFSEMDQTAFKRRAGLIEQHKIVRKDIWS